jgi:hypothetical protein
MDNDTLVAGGAGGLDRIAECFRLKGIPVSGIYLIKLTAENGFEDWIIRLVCLMLTPGSGSTSFHGRSRNPNAYWTTRRDLAVFR